MAFRNPKPASAEKPPTVPTLLTPSNETGAPPTLPVLINVAAEIVPVAFCVTPLSPVRSTTLARTTCPLFSDMPPAGPETKFAVTVAFTVPDKAMALPVRNTLLPVKLPPAVRVESVFSTISPAPLVTVPGTFSAEPAFKVNPAEEKSPRVATLLTMAVAPNNVTAPAALPVNVPATSVPVSPMVVAVETRFTVPEPPSVTVPGMTMLAPFNATAAAETVPEIVNAASVVRFAPEAVAAPTTSTAPVAVSCNVPVAAKSPSFEATLVVSVKVTILATPLSVPVVFNAPPAAWVMAPDVRKSRLTAFASKPAAATAIAVAVVRTLGCVSPPRRTVPAVMPVRSTSDNPPAPPKVIPIEVNGASSNVPVAVASAEAAESPTKLSVCNPTTAPAVAALTVEAATKLNVGADRNTLPAAA